MSKSLRLSEKWFHRGLWLVALAFAWFLIGLGGTLVGDLPQVERSFGREDFIDQVRAQPLRATIEQAGQVQQAAERELDQAELRLTGAQQANQQARETFANWLATRRATQQGAQDAELIERTKALDQLKDKEAAAQQAVEAQRKIQLDAAQRQQGATEQLGALERDADEQLYAEQRRVELRVFGYRLALTLPLLVVAGWLFARKRRSTWWPFVWGFIFFALFAFFVELVPYLPSYGGYVRYAVGIVVTVLVGRYVILALNRYLARQKLAEQQPDTMRRQELNYDTALARLAKSVCPGCERPVDLKDGTIDFCPHCGIGLFDHCRACDTRKSAFARFCHGCGAGATLPPPETPAHVAPAAAL